MESQGDEIMEMVRRHELEEEEKRRQAEGMSAGDEYRMMLVVAERHARETEMVEEEIQERREARKKVVEGMEEMIKKGHGTYGSEGIRPREQIERKKNRKWERGDR